MDVPVAQYYNHWYQHDGCAAHFSLAVRQHPNETYGQRWIGRVGPVRWPLLSPDLTPPDFYLWGTMEDMIYKEPVEDVEDLQARILLAGEAITDNPGVFEQIRRSWLDRCQKCLDQNGGHFEQLL